MAEYHTDFISKLRHQIFGAGDLVLEKIQLIINPPPETNKFILAFAKPQVNTFKQAIDKKRFDAFNPLDLATWKLANCTYNQMDQFVLGIEFNYGCKIISMIAKQSDIRDEHVFSITEICTSLSIMNLEVCPNVTDKSLLYQSTKKKPFFFCLL